MVELLGAPAPGLGNPPLFKASIPAPLAAPAGLVLLSALLAVCGMHALGRTGRHRLSA